MANKRSGSERRQAMFAAAVPAVAAMWPEREGSYCCPLCGEFFTEEQIDLLRPDHVPPRCLKEYRRVQVLTCHRCNHLAGTLLDLAMLEHEELCDARRRRMTRPRRGFVMTAQGRVAVETLINGNNVLQFVVPEASSKKAHAAWVQEMETQLVDGGKVSLGRLRPPLRSRSSAETGWLRSAYLVAFAAFGYRYAFGPALQKVRAQLDPANLTSTLIRGFGLRLHGAKKSDAAIRRIDEPKRRRSVMVQMGEALIFLPVLNHAKLYARLADESSRIATLEERWVEVPWPVPPTYGIT